MADSSRNPKISLRALVDKEKNKIVLVETGSPLLVSKQSQQTPVGCYSNIYKSVLDMEIDNFLTEACKNMLLYPRSLDDNLLRRLKVNVNETTEAAKFFICPGYKNETLCSPLWASFNTSKCRCGKKMERKIESWNESNLGNDVDGVFVVSGKPSFIITNDMIVQSNSTNVYLKVVKDQGYLDADKLSESFLVIGSEEVLTLLECLFSSDTPLTDAFLRKQSSRSMNRLHMTLPSPAVQDDTNNAESRLTLNVVVRKQDKKVLYFECREDFVNLLLTFLTVSLEFVLENSGGSMPRGCTLNLFSSFKDLSCEKKIGSSSTSKLPWYYSLQNQLLDINTEEQPYFVFNGNQRLERLHVYLGRIDSGENVVSVNHICPHSDQSIRCNACKGFVKGNMKFRVSDDLIITSLSSSSTIAYLKQFQVSLDDVDVQEISIGKKEVNSVLRSSFMTSTVLSNAFLDLLVKKPKEET